MPADRIAWGRVLARWGSEVYEPHLAIVPKGFAQLVLAIAERFQWEATYRVDGYDFADWDDLQAMVDAGLAGLTDTMRLSDLLAYFDDVEPLLTQLLEKDTCCPDTTGLEDMFPGWEDIVGAPDEIDNTGYDIIADEGDPPPGASDWTEWHSKLCDAAQKYADGLPRVISLAESLQSVVQGLTIAAIGAIVASSIAILGIPIVVLGVVTTVLDLLQILNGLRQAVSGEDGWSQMRQDLEDARQDIVCAIITAKTPLQASQQVQAVISSVNPNAWNIIRLLTFPGNVMQRIFNMQSDVVGGFYGPCGTCGTPPPVGVWMHQESPWGGFVFSVQDDEHCFTSVEGAAADFVTVYLFADEARTTPLVGDVTVVSDSAAGVSGNGAPQYRAWDSTGQLLYSSDTLAGLQGLRCHKVVIRHNADDFEACLSFADIGVV